MTMYNTRGERCTAYSLQDMRGWYGSFYHAGAYYLGAARNDATMTTMAPTLNNMRTYAFIAPNRDCTLDQVAINVTVAGAAPAGATIGIYSSSLLKNMARYNHGNTLLGQSSVLDCSTTGVKTSSMNVAIKANRIYHVAMVCEKTITVRLNGAESSVGSGWADDMTSIVGMGQGVATAFTYTGTMPDSLLYGLLPSSVGGTLGLDVPTNVNNQVVFLRFT